MEIVQRHWVGWTPGGGLAGLNGGTWRVIYAPAVSYVHSVLIAAGEYDIRVIALDVNGVALPDGEYVVLTKTFPL